MPQIGFWFDSIHWRSEDPDFDRPIMRTSFEYSIMPRVSLPLPPNPLVSNPWLRSDNRQTLIASGMQLRILELPVPPQPMIDRMMYCMFEICISLSKWVVFRIGSPGAACIAELEMIAELRRRRAELILRLFVYSFYMMLGGNFWTEFDPIIVFL